MDPVSKPTLNIIKCPKCRNFYDGDEYTSCPHCSAGTAGGNTASASEQGQRKRAGLFRRGSGNTGGGQPERRTGGEAQTVPESEAVTIAETTGLQETGDGNNYAGPGEETVTEGVFIASAARCERCGSLYDARANQSCPNCAGRDAQETGQSAGEGTLRAAIRNSSSTKEGVTLSYFSAMTEAASAAAEAPAQRASEPVVGWIVCVKGVHFGESFPIFTGNCAIGRDPSNKVAIEGDQSISAFKHAFIIYEPKKRKFYLKPGESSGLVYLNDEHVFETTALHAKDKIELGKSIFLFVPLCDETFSWEEYINRG